jgi:hypothetical protein
MAAYATMVRIDRVKPHRAGHASASARVWRPAEPLAEPEAIDLVGRPLLTFVAERWAGLRETWAQTTFYLFHAEGWR